MGSCNISIIGLILFNIIYSSYTEDSTFSQENRSEHLLIPANVNGQRLYTYYENDSTVITSPEPGYQDCKIPGIIPSNHRHELGNGKMVAFTPIYTHFSILDFKNCSSYTPIHINDGKPYYYDSQLEIHAVIPHYNTFDVYNLRNRACNPCRYNDKGERLQVDNILMPETDKASKYFLEPITNISGVSNGYLNGISFRANDSTTLRVLDSNYNIVKERSLDGQYLDSSTTHGNVTVCTSINTCPDSFFDCLAPRCQLLDSNLNTIANVGVQQPKGNPMFVYVHIKNLKDGGAMISMEFGYYDLLNGDSRQDIFIQQINANGKVEPVIRLGRFDAEYVSFHHYMLKSEEYCAVLSLEKKEDKDYSLIKCVIPKTPRKD
ncbi:uncharacterized protein LOC131672188 [Phymastichus coffea]|uniref:uncharacterized protein LOC131672188 n=1 Tax=Phymastichus coffea TaxID=108790 RepID=UPI00273AE7EF|nr:uncharacterized protein LOC131672188 [Phymastichus coffea]XP_058805235.1 uncharacterized protein LOC131672188 [Phymastichus coffea]